MCGFLLCVCLVYLAVNRVKLGHEMGRDEGLIPGHGPALSTGIARTKTNISASSTRACGGYNQLVVMDLKNLNLELGALTLYQVAS